MTTKTIRLCLVALPCLFIPSLSSAFDCNKATRAIEFLICQTPDIKQQDDEMSALYHQLVARNTPLVPTQPEWRNKQRDFCPDVACLRSVYAARIVYFQSLLAALAPQPPNANQTAPIALPPEYEEAVPQNVAHPPVTPEAARPETQPSEPVQQAAEPEPPSAINSATTPAPAKPVSGEKQEAKPAPTAAPSPQTAKTNWSGLFFGAVALAALFGIYKLLRVPEARTAVREALLNLRKWLVALPPMLLAFRASAPPERLSGNQRIRFSVLRFFLVTLPITALTLWLLYNIADVIAAGVGLDPFHAEPDCSPPPQPTSQPSLEFLNWQEEITVYYQNHPECLPQKPGTRFMDLIEHKGFLIPYYFYALPFALYLVLRLVVRRVILDRKSLVRVALAFSMALSPVLLSLIWPLLPGLPKDKPLLNFSLMILAPLPVMLVAGTTAITGFFGGIFSVISAVALPVVALFNQINAFMINRQRQELQTTGVHIWWQQFRHWLAGIPLPPLPPDDSKGARFATLPEIDALRRDHLTAHGYRTQEP